MEIIEEEEEIQEETKGIADIEMVSMSTATIGHTAIEKIIEMEDNRKKCTRI